CRGFRPVTSRRLISADRLTALILIVVFAAYGLYGYTFQSSLGVDVVGPGFYPTVIGILGVVLAALLLVRHRPGNLEEAAPVEREGEVGGQNWLGELRVFIPVVLLLVYVLTLESIGFPITTFVFLTVSIRFFGCPSWLRAGLFALAGTVGAILLFHFALELRLPQGRLIHFW